MLEEFLERSLDECQRCAYLVCHIGEEFNLRLVEFLFLFVFKLLHGILALFACSVLQDAYGKIRQGCQAEQIEEICPP